VAGGATSLLRRFVELNTRASAALERLLRVENEIALWHRFHELVGDSLRELPAGASFVDLGGGRRCDYAEFVPRERSVRLIAVDVSAEELAHNTDADEKIVADVARGLPFADGQIDLLVSRVVFEHIDGVPDAVGQIARVMKPGGRTIHLMPGRNALFALAARLLPFERLLRVLHFVLPATAGHVEFDVHYDHTEPVAIKRLFVEAGFRNVTVEWTAAQADYFRPVAPLYLLVALYQWLVRALGIKRLAAYLIVAAER
jgi:SAM-dependent methyltransferase